MGESSRSAETRGHFENYRAALNEAKLAPLNGRNRHLMFSRKVDELMKTNASVMLWMWEHGNIQPRPTCSVDFYYLIYYLQQSKTKLMLKYQCQL